MNYLFLKLLYDCKNIALANDDILLAVELDLGAGVLAGDDLLALLDLHLDLLTVNDAAGADLDDLRYLRLFLSGCGQNDTACGGLLCLYHFNDNTVAKGLEFHNGLPPMKNKNIHCRELSTQNTGVLTRVLYYINSRYYARG